MCGVFHAPDRLSEAEHNPLTKSASSVTLNAQSTATELGRDPDMYCNLPTANLLAPQPKVRDRKTRPPDIAMPNKNQVHFFIDMNKTWRIMRRLHESSQRLRFGPDFELSSR